jgi:hypothetical protein
MPSQIAVAELQVNQPLIPQVIAGLQAVSARYDRAMAALPAALHDTLRPDGGWSANQILEHLCLANGAYLRAMKKQVVLPATTAASVPRWTPTLAGRFLVWALTGERKLPAPSRAKPGPTARPDVLRVMQATTDDMRDFLQRADGHDLSRLRFTSPLASFLSMNVGDSGVVVLRHLERHARQLERLVAELRATV